MANSSTLSLCTVTAGFKTPSSLVVNLPEVSLSLVAAVSAGPDGQTADRAEEKEASQCLERASTCRLKPRTV